ncbi:MAG: tRNA guanosine(34) transglycosylase Tgt [Candidatus Magasanikbacteria bacterium]|nr:tRNA guanosine(34) transglycosylase Tgt [Candidatus Magasanikbacteria bacterium]
MPFFELQHKDENSRARTGVIHTDHGDILTPIFMPVGTQATVKTLDQTDLQNLPAQIILGNTYHLHLRPGEDLINEFGGLHKFMNWNKPILTDSGGFQVFSLGKQKRSRPTTVIPSAVEGSLKPDERDSSTLSTDSGRNDNAQLVSIDEEGVTFKSHIDGSSHRFTPEIAVETQHKIGADIIMAFDECTPDSVEEKYAREAMERTHRWAKRSLDEHQKLSAQNTRDYKQFLFGIIQGSVYKNLRQESAKYISSLDFDGIAIGGESVGYNMEATKDILDWVFPLIPENKPHYAMGIGLSPTDLLIAIEHGVDMFDCVAPTRLARHGMLFVGPTEEQKLRINITNKKYATDSGPVDPNCGCHTCQHYSRAYLHHLFNAGEISAMRLSSIHNLFFMLDLMRQARTAIQENKFMELKNKWI